MGRPHRRISSRLTLLSGAVTLALTGTLLAPMMAAAVPAPPPNPSDDQIAAADSHAASNAQEVGRLSGVISTTQAQIQQLNNAMELKAELAMKARMDVVIKANDAADAAAAADDAARLADEADTAIAQAEEQAARFAAASFRQGTSMSTAMTALVDSSSLEELLARNQLVEQVSGTQSSVISALQTARTVKANRVSQAKAAQQRAAQAQRDAEDAQDAAEKAEQEAADAFADGQAQLAKLEDQLRQQQADYQAALNQAATLKGQRAQYQAWQIAKRQEDQQVADQAATHRAEVRQLQRDRELATQLQAEDATNRAVAVRNEEKRQEKLAAERKRIAALQKQAEAEGRDPAEVDTSALSGSARGKAVVQAALKWLGTTYAWGGGNANGPTRGIRDYGVADRYGDYNKIGFDCSGLALYAWAQQGVYLPHYSGYQYNYGKRIAKSNLQPGDLVFFAYNTSNPATIHHVAIYMGNGQMIEAPQSGSVVKISPLRTSGYIGATRPGT